MGHRPRATGNPHVRRGVATPVAGTPDRDDDRPPAFSFEHVDHEYVGAWSWPDVNSSEAGELLRFLCEISRYTWAELVRLHGGSYHHEQDIEEVCEQAQNRIVELGHDAQFEKLFRLRVGHRKRLWGFATEGVFYVLWWDPDHKVYELPDL